MALTRLTHDGYGQIELNNVTFRRDGRIEAQCAFDVAEFTVDAKAENGMILAIDKANKKIKLPKAGEILPLAINYSTEHMYDEREDGLKNFALKGGDYGRMGYLAVGEIFTTNCVGFDTQKDAAWANEDAVITALGKIAETPVYGTYSETGAILLTATAPADGLLLNVAEFTTMPDGQLGIKFQVARV